MTRLIFYEKGTILEYPKLMPERQMRKETCFRGCIRKSHQTACLCADCKGVHKHPLCRCTRSAYLRLVQKREFIKKTF